MRPGVAGICGARRTPWSCWSDAPALHVDSIKAAVRFAANMVRKKFPWAFYRPNKVKVAGAIQFQSMLADIGRMGETGNFADMHRGSQAE
jgi:hypothetical protein